MKIAIIIAFRDFQDEEYFITKQILETAGAKIDTASDSTGAAVGASGGETEVNVLLENLNAADYDAVLFIGGPGAVKFIDNPFCHKIAKDVVSAAKILGAICIAPAILAKSGVLQGKKATVWSSIMDKSAIKILKDSGAIYYSGPVAIDGKIITANGPEAAKDFAENIIGKLIGKK